jgi:hypothetical protein
LSIAAYRLSTEVLSRDTARERMRLQVVVGGKDKYMINGVSAQPKCAI